MLRFLYHLKAHRVLSILSMKLEKNIRNGFNIFQCSSSFETLLRYTHYPSVVFCFLLLQEALPFLYTTGSGCWAKPLLVYNRGSHDLFACSADFFCMSTCDWLRRSVWLWTRFAYSLRETWLLPSIEKEARSWCLWRKQGEKVAGRTLCFLLWWPWCFGLHATGVILHVAYSVTVHADWAVSTCPLLVAVVSCNTSCHGGLCLARQRSEMPSWILLWYGVCRVCSVCMPSFVKCPVIECQTCASDPLRAGRLLMLIIPSWRKLLC